MKHHREGELQPVCGDDIHGWQFSKTEVPEAFADTMGRLFYVDLRREGQTRSRTVQRDRPGRRRSSSAAGATQEDRSYYA